MKARLPLNNKLRQRIRECAIAETNKRLDEANMRSSEVFLLACACVLHIHWGFGRIRLSRFLRQLQDFYEFLGGYDDSAKWKCLQILEDAGINWDEFCNRGAA